MCNMFSTKLVEIRIYKVSLQVNNEKNFNLQI